MSFLRTKRMMFLVALVAIAGTAGGFELGRQLPKKLVTFGSHKS